MMGVSYESFISVQTENAKLKTINAELLEALEGFVAFIGKSRDEAAVDLVAQANKAIRKAKGE